MSAQRPIPTSNTVIMRRYIVIIQTPTTRLVFRSDTTCGSPTTTILESRVAMKIPTVVTVRTTHLYSKRNRHTTSSIFRKESEKLEYKPRPKNPELTTGYSSHDFSEHTILEARIRHSLGEMIKDINNI